LSQKRLREEKRGGFMRKTRKGEKGHGGNAGGLGTPSEPGGMTQDNKKNRME